MHTLTVNSNGFLTNAAPKVGSPASPFTRHNSAGASEPPPCWGRPHFLASRGCRGPRFSARYSHKSSRQGQDSQGRSTLVELPVISQPVDRRPRRQPEAARRPGCGGRSLPPHFPAPGAGEGGGLSSDVRLPHIGPIPRTLSGPGSGDRDTLTLGRAPRRRSPSSARQPAGSSSGSSSSGGSSGRSPGGGGGGGCGRRARAMAGAGCGSQAGPGRAAPAVLRTPLEVPACQARKAAFARSQEIRERRGCNPGEWLRDRGGAPSRRCWQVGPAGIWTDRSRRIPDARELRATGLGEGPGRESASGRSSGCTVIRRFAAGPTRIRGSRYTRRPGSEEGSCCAAHVLTSAVPSAGAAGLGERGGTGCLPVNAAAPPLATESTLQEFNWSRLYQAHPLGLGGLEWEGLRKR